MKRRPGGARRFALAIAIGALLLCAPGCRAAGSDGAESESPPERSAPDESLPAGARADRVVVDKSDHTLTLYAGDRALKTYRVALGTEPVGDKICQGDRRTPEGRYVLDYRNPNSKYHRSIHVSYPDAADRREAAARGCPPGGDIMIHGLPPGWDSLARLVDPLPDWTLGCIALRNAEMDEIWNAVADGTPIEIQP